MAYILDGTTIRRPSSFNEQKSQQMAIQRTLDGSINRDLFGSGKRVWTYNYEDVNVTDYAVLKAIYDSYISTGALKTWQVTESNYTVAETNVHVDLVERNFSVKGTSYLSTFTLVLTEA